MSGCGNCNSSGMTRNGNYCSVCNPNGHLLDEFMVDCITPNQDRERGPVSCGCHNEKQMRKLRKYINEYWPCDKDYEESEYIINIITTLTNEIDVLQTPTYGGPKEEEE